MSSGKHHSLRAFGLGLSVVAAGLFVAAPVALAKARVARLRTIHAKVVVPGSWKKTKVTRGKNVTFKMRRGGKFSVTWKQRKLPLRLVAKAVKKRGARLGWRLIEEKRSIRHRGKRAHLLVYDVPTKVRGVKVRSAFFFVNTRNGYYTLYFGTKRRLFRNGLYKAVYSTFDTL